jgi:GntR family histidine utilization transcriptional repressor
MASSVQTSANRPMPAYERIKVDILHHIDGGTWRPGDRIPSENDLVRQFGVSRMTVNRALRELTNDGRLLRVPGTGTFVAEPDTDSGLLNIRSVDDYIAAHGGKHRSEVMSLEEVVADDAVAALLDTVAGVRLFHIVMRHFDDETPFQLEDRYVNADLVPGFVDQDFNSRTPSSYLTDAVPVTEIEHVIESVAPDVDEQKFLKLAASDPCLVLRRRTWWNDDVVTHVRFVSPGHLFRLSGRFKPFSRR